ncbi:VWA domain-containing protein [Atopobacter phocae]|uniref:VWA domain-containing protein n=1 Tax=Atopobacter phocae TaxID=136492 RepID=UPI000470F585|nr:VWA domain-containing protein [Atopobacter phocae]
MNRNKTFYRWMTYGFLFSLFMQLISSCVNITKSIQADDRTSYIHGTYSEHAGEGEWTLLINQEEKLIEDFQLNVQFHDPKVTLKEVILDEDSDDPYQPIKVTKNEQEYLNNYENYKNYLNKKEAYQLAKEAAEKQSYSEKTPPLEVEETADKQEQELMEEEIESEVTEPTAKETNLIDPFNEEAEQQWQLIYQKNDGQYQMMLPKGHNKQVIKWRIKLPEKRTANVTSKVDVTIAMTDETQQTFEASFDSEVDQIDQVTPRAFRSAEYRVSIDEKAINYTNKAPKYTNDDNKKGVFPTHSWKPTNQQNVINHQGFSLKKGTWDGNGQWDGDPNNTQDSYIEYGENKTNPDFSIRKYARETNEKGLYDVYLNIKGNEKRNVKPVDIVLVIDMSGSMLDNNKYIEMRNGVIEFIEYIQNYGNKDKIKVGAVGYAGRQLINDRYTGSADIKFSVDLGSIENNKQQIIDGVQRTIRGGTFTQAGLMEGYRILKKGTAEDKRLIVLTDGVPTYSYHLESAERVGNLVYGVDNYGTLIEGTGGTSKLESVQYARNIYARDQYYRDYWLTISDTFSATLGEADKIKSQGIDINVLGIQLASDYVNYLSQEDVKYRMELMASQGKYESADYSHQIFEYLVAQAKTIVEGFNTVNQGEIVDPLGNMFHFDNSDITIKRVDQGNVINPSVPKLDKSDRELKVSDINLGKGQEVQIHYRVRMNTESKEFIPGKWYPLNGKTTFKPNHNSDSKVDFGVPSAKAPGTRLKLSKEWIEYDKDASSRPKEIYFEVERSPMTSESWAKGYVAMDGKNGWENKRIEKILAEQKIGSDKEYWLPEFNNQGETFKYNIKEIPVEGYKSEKGKDNSHWINTKEFKPYKLKLIKKDAHTKKELSEAEFSIMKDNKELAVGTTNDDGIIEFKNEQNEILELNPGEYLIQEIKQPEGYHLLKQPIKLKILETGNVKLENKDDFYDMKYDTYKQTIELTVLNLSKSEFPKTGSSLEMIYLTVGILLVNIAIFSWWHNEKQENLKYN